MSSYIRLVDGGNSENLGAYSLISRGAKNIIVSDAAQHVHGAVQDLCDLQEQLWKRKKLALHVPGLQNFAAHCANQDRSGLLAKKGYPVAHWPYPVIAACVSTRLADTGCAESAQIAHRLCIVKPAFDIECFLRSQQASSDVYTCVPRSKSEAALSRAPDVIKCAMSKDDDQRYLPCETAGFIADNWATIH